jgi:heterodisulfide reductase subunit C
MALPAYREPAPLKEIELRDAFWAQLRSIPRGERIQNCIQCGTCTGTCPVSYLMDITPRQIVALFRAGYLEEILNSRAIWICASCYACRVRCPQGILVTDMMYALKRIGISRGIYPPGFPAYSLSRSFISNIYKYGRNFEMGLAIKYLLSSAPKKLLSSASFGLAMVRKGRISMKPTTIKKIHEVRAIIDRARQLEAEGA